ncbi:MAG: hypothetical protein M3220_16650 [Chloroflexota bacterium]|nr:hypothetical protein [Chloroflexota bacterium]
MLRFGIGCRRYLAGLVVTLLLALTAMLLWFSEARAQDFIEYVIKIDVRVTENCEVDDYRIEVDDSIRVDEDEVKIRVAPSPDGRQCTVRIEAPVALPSWPFLKYTMTETDGVLDETKTKRVKSADSSTIYEVESQTQVDRGGTFTHRYWFGF